MASDDLTIEILRSIRDEIAGTNQRLEHLEEQTNQRLDQTNQRLEGIEVRMGRVEQGVVDLGGFMRQLALDMSRYERLHAHHIVLIEDDLKDVKARVRALEERR